MRDLRCVLLLIISPFILLVTKVSVNGDMVEFFNMKILLIRHGENQYTATGKLAGHLPVELNERGHEQAKQVAEHLKDVKLKAIFASPLVRTMQTAQPLADLKGMPILECPGIIEMRFGDWEDKLLKDLRKKKLWKAVQSAPSTVTFPNGESFRAAQARAVDTVEALAKEYSGKKDTIAIYAHSDIIKLVMAHYLGTPLDMFQRIAISTASISVLHFMKEARMVGAVNKTL